MNDIELNRDELRFYKRIVKKELCSKMFMIEFIQWVRESKATYIWDNPDMVIDFSFQAYLKGRFTS